MKLLILLFFFSPLVNANNNYLQKLINKIDQKKLSESKQWKNFLHSESSIFGSRSQADTESFFISKNGKWNLDDELKELVKAIIFKSTPRGDKNVLCRFPARSRWLKKTLKMKAQYFNFEQCTSYLKYKNKLSSQSVSIVFSSYYLESPASAFGHTLIRLNKKNGSHSKSRRNELLDTGIGYAANPTTNNAILYALMGMMGGFQGQLSLIPYFYKIREYNDFESRDLWSYDLKLSQTQVDKLLDHSWEIGQSKFDYFYFTENCSYKILAILDAVNPKFNLLEKIPYFVIPIDTVKVINEAGLVKNINFRPSIKRKLDHYISLLKENEKKLFLTIIQNENLKTLKNSSLNKYSKVKVIDTLIQYADFRYSAEILNQKGKKYEWKNKILELRARYPLVGINSEPTAPIHDSPEKGHDSARLGVSVGKHKNDKEIADFSFRIAMHDILDPRKGQPRYSNLEFLNTKVRYFNEQKKVKLDRLKIFSIMTLNPWSDYQKPKSMRAQLGVKRKAAALCDYCLVANVEAALGASWKLGPAVLFAMGESETNYSTEFVNNKNWAIGLGASVNLLAAWNDTFLTLFQSKFLNYFIVDEREFSLAQETRFHIKNKWSLALATKMIDKNYEGTLGFYYYY